MTSAAKVLPKGRTPAGLDASRQFDDPHDNEARLFWAQLADRIGATPKGERDSAAEIAATAARARRWTLTPTEHHDWNALVLDHIDRGHLAEHAAAFQADKLHPRVAKWEKTSREFLQRQAGGSKSGAEAMLKRMTGVVRRDPEMRRFFEVTGLGSHPAVLKFFADNLIRLEEGVLWADNAQPPVRESKDPPSGKTTHVGVGEMLPGEKLYQSSGG